MPRVCSFGLALRLQNCGKKKRERALRERERTRSLFGATWAHRGLAWPFVRESDSDRPTARERLSNCGATERTRDYGCGGRLLWDRLPRVTKVASRAQSKITSKKLARVHESRGCSSYKVQSCKGGDHDRYRIGEL